MGEAKNRGSYEQRKAEAIERNKIEAEKRKQEYIERASQVKLSPKRRRGSLMMATAMALSIPPKFR